MLVWHKISLCAFISVRKESLSAPSSLSLTLWISIHGICFHPFCVDAVYVFVRVRIMCACGSPPHSTEIFQFNCDCHYLYISLRSNFPPQITPSLEIEISINIHFDMHTCTSESSCVVLGMEQCLRGTNDSVCNNTLLRKCDLKFEFFR